MCYRSYLIILLYYGLLSEQFVNGDLVACPYEPVVLSCTSTTFHVWSGPAFKCSEASPVNTITALSIDSLHMNYTCGDIRATLTSKAGPVITSQLQFTAVPALDGTRITCEGDPSLEGVVYNETVKVNIHTITDVDTTGDCVELQVTTIGDPSNCYKEFIFSTNGTDNMDSVTPGSSTTFTGDICGLCFLQCDYYYTVEGVLVYGDGQSISVSTTTNSDLECPQLNSVNVDEPNRNIKLFLSNLMENNICMDVEPNEFGYVINETAGSITWAFRYCTGVYNLDLQFTCCPDLTTDSYDTSVEIRETELRMMYYCSTGTVTVSASATTNRGISPVVSLTVSDQPGSADELYTVISVPMVYQNYTASGMASLDDCDSTRKEMVFVPNIIMSHKVAFPESKTAEISVTYADCEEDDTSNFIVGVVYWIDSTMPMTLPPQDFDSTSVFVLNDLMPGRKYQFTIEVKDGESRIGATVAGEFTMPSTGAPVGAIVGGVIGGLVVIAVIAVVIIVLVILICKKKGGTNGTEKSELEMDE